MVTVANAIENDQLRQNNEFFFFKMIFVMTSVIIRIEWLILSVYLRNKNEKVCIIV